MKRLILCALFSAMLSAQTATKPGVDQVRATPTFTGVVVVINGTLLVAQLDASVAIDTTAGRPIIRAVYPTPPIIPVPVEEELSPTAMTLGATPLPGTLEVFRNGIRLRVGRDFTLADKAVTFTAQPILPDDLIVARYWPER